MNLLLIDGDPEFRACMQRRLEGSGVDCQTAQDGVQALRLMKKSGRGAFDLVLLDAILPGLSGLTVLERLRMQGDRTPVIFLTSRHSVEERVKGLRLGADDYVIKPFEFSELLARIEAVRRRCDGSAAFRLGSLHVDIEHRRVECRGVRIEMSPREFSLLLALARAQFRSLSHSELLHQVWGIDFDPGTNVVAVQIARLRRRMKPWAPGLIRTVARQGYALVEELTTERQGPPPALASTDSRQT